MRNFQKLKEISDYEILDVPEEVHIGRRTVPPNFQVKSFRNSLIEYEK